MEYSKSPPPIRNEMWVRSTLNGGDVSVPRGPSPLTALLAAPSPTWLKMPSWRGTRPSAGPGSNALPVAVQPA